MNRKEFLAALSKTPRDWFIDSIGAIRRSGIESGRQCPITSLQDQFLGCWQEVADMLHIPEPLMNQIIAAADKKHDIKNWYLRRQIKKACGL